jgi:two-component sensor histidine kinase
VLLPILTCTIHGVDDIGPTRRALCRALHGRHAASEQVDAVALIASELMTNAIMYGVPPMALSISTPARASSPGPVTVTMCDHGATMPALRDPKATPRLGGYGLQLVDATASSWGVRADGAVKEVWAVVPASPSPLRAR